MKDKHGNELPEPRREVNIKDLHYENRPSGYCHNCKVPIKDQQLTYRLFGSGGNENLVIQGPLCPNCSELPPEYLPSRKVGERWW